MYDVTKPIVNTIQPCTDRKIGSQIKSFLLGTLLTTQSKTVLKHIRHRESCRNQFMIFRRAERLIRKRQQLRNAA